MDAYRTISGALAAMVVLSGCAATRDAPSCSLAIEHVAVVPMDGERILADQTVRIEGDRVLSVQRARAPGPRCARIVDGRGHFLAPGLIDAHVHVESDMFARVFTGQEAVIPFQDVLFAYLSNGVTGVRVMSGAPDILAFRDNGVALAPRLMVASPMLSGAPPIMPEPITRVVTDAQAAAAAVDEYADAGYDLIKLRENLSPEALRAVMEAAARRGLPVDGHLPRGGTDALAMGPRGVAHVDEISLRVDDTRTAAAWAERLRACRCYVASTLSVEDNVAAQLRDYDAVAARPETRFVHPLMRRALWERARNPYLAEGQDPAFFEALLETDKEVIRALRDAGVPILAGTDALIPMIAPGYSLHDELELLVEAGLTPYQALASATSTPASLFARFADAGLVAQGRRADLVLLERNPLEDVRALRQPSAVIVAGVYLDRAQLDQRMEVLAAGYTD